MEQESGEAEEEGGEKCGLVIWSTNADVFNMDKIVELRSRIFAAKYKPDIIAISEVRAKNQRAEISPTIYNLDGYAQECININGKVGRGMILYVRVGLQYNLISASSIISMPVQEVILVEIKLRHHDTLCFCAVYRSPNSDQINNDLLRQFLMVLVTKHFKYLVIAGDFNLRMIDWNLQCCTVGENAVDFKFLETIKDCFLTQHVTESTRGRGTNLPSLLDLVLTNGGDFLESVSHESPLGKSDHALLNISVSCHGETAVVNKPRRLYDRGDYQLLARELDVDWVGLFSGYENDVESQWRMMKDRLEAAVEMSIPTTKANGTVPKGRNPLDKEIRKKIKRKNRLWKKFSATRDHRDYTEYCQARNQTRRLTRKAKRDYEKKLAHEVKQNPKKFWKYVNSKTKSRSGIPDLNKDPDGGNGETTGSDQEKAEVLAKFFTSVFTEEPEGIWQLPKREPVKHDMLIMIDLSEETVKKLLLNVNTSKSPGPDGIHPRVLKEASNSIAKPLSIIFETSLNTGKLPLEWKQANITAIYKKGDKKEAGNYRPVSLTSVICKIMETLIRDSLVQFMNQNEYFSDRQYGFMKGRSTTLQLIRVMEIWTDVLDRGGCIDVVYCDFMKAFDKVPHNRLVQVLENYGVPDPVLRWIRCFLNNRSQRVMVNGKASEWYGVLSGIPQGSVLGPILFVIYINSLPEVVKSSEVFLFADDTKVFKEVQEERDCDQLQQDLEAMYKWTEKSLLKFHPEKCAVMRIGTSELEARDYTMGPLNTTIKQSTVERDIGVFIDNKLSFDEHISNKINKANSTMGIIRRTYDYLDKFSFLLLYKALVRPHLEYANQVWSPMLKRQEISIENVQRRATKLIPGLKDLTYEDRLRNLQLPTLKYRRVRGDMIEMFKILTGKYDERVSDFIDLHSPEQCTRGHQYKIKKYQVRLNIRQNSFINRSVNIWNNLPTGVVNASSVRSFEARLDSHWSSQPFLYNPDADYENTTARKTYLEPTSEDRKDLSSEVFL